MDILDDIFPLYSRLVTRCERIAIQESKARCDLSDLGDPWYAPHVDDFHYQQLNKLLTERFIETFLQRYTTASVSSIIQYHDQVSTGKVFVDLKVKSKGEYTVVRLELPRLIMTKPVWYPNYHRPRQGYWRGAINDSITLQACGVLDLLRAAFYSYLKPDEGLTREYEHITQPLSMDELNRNNRVYQKDVERSVPMLNEGNLPFHVIHNPRFAPLTGEQIKKLCDVQGATRDRDFFNLWTKPPAKDEKDDT